jgi:REP element-mobilizing transposase RayT
MAIARSKLFRDGTDVIIHAYNRTIRGAFLHGVDELTGKDYSHRKGIMERRLQFLSQFFSIDVCGYAILSNHYHIIIKGRPDRSAQWSPRQIALHWWWIFPKRRDPYGNPADPKDHELDEILVDPETGTPEGRLEELRKRLTSISWFMRCLNEYMAKISNTEDECTGRFWEGRFKSTTLLDQSAVLACLAYVDLNPIHAGIAETPEESDYTSARTRIEHKITKERLTVLQAEFSKRKKRTEKKRELELNILKLEESLVTTAWLAPLFRTPLNRPVEGSQSFLNMDLEEYLELLDWTGRQHRADKKGKIPAELDTILSRLELDNEAWLDTVTHFGSWFHNVAGKLDAIRNAALEAGSRWFAGVKGAKTAFN